MLEKLIILAVGWLLGLLAPVIVEKVKAEREAGAVTAAIKNELNEVAYRMVLAAYNTLMHLGMVDRDFLKWLQDSITLYQGMEPKENIVKSIEVKLSLTPEQLAAITASEAAQGVRSLVLVKFAVPFVDARVSAFHSLAGTVQLQLLSVRADVRLLDDLVDQSRTYFNLTFGKLEEANYATVVENLRGVYMQYAKRCRIAADRIHRLQGVL
jgi:hypothetical protein